GSATGANIHLYRNGVELAYSSTVNAAGTRLDDTAGILRIGNNDLLNRTFAGDLDDVRVYNRALSAAEVQAIYTSAPPETDSTPPAVSLTAPAGGATVSGSVALSATASDNVGVVGVQFKLDGANLGAEDTTAPYSISWDTTTAS